jgi:hypothetical protein
MSAIAGYSGTALVKKMGIKQGFAIHTIGAPPDYRALVQPLPAGVRELALPLGFVDIKVCAVTEVWSGLMLVIRKELR